VCVAAPMAAPVRGVAADWLSAVVEAAVASAGAEKRETTGVAGVETTRAPMAVRARSVSMVLESRLISSMSPHPATSASSAASRMRSWQLGGGRGEGVDGG